LHPYTGNGPDIGRPLTPYAEREGWVVVAPTFPYRDWRDPEMVRKDDAEFMPALHSILAGLEGRTGLALADRALLYGFSRGAQTAHRYALAYPEEVAGVAAFAAGTYTLPKTTWADAGSPAASLLYPYGVGDISKYCGKAFDLEAVKHVQFLIGVGSQDHESADVPRNWDKYIGDCRFDRAGSFTQALRDAGVSVRKMEFSNTSHVETDEMRAAGVEFLRQVAGEVGL
jgi:pimeloyl-ACP methyl ester carboxylesterase